MQSYWNDFLKRNEKHTVLFRYGYLEEYKGKVKIGCLKRFCRLFLRDTIVCTNPQRLNDPFEFKPRLEIRDYDKARKKFEKKYIEKGYSQGEAKQSSFDIVSDINLRRNIEREYQKNIGKCGVFCLTEKWDNHLMWAHYAVSHQGFCLVFVFKDGYPEKEKLRKVEYSDTQPVFIFEDEDYEDSGKKSMRTKLQCWDYEREVRLFSEHEGRIDKPSKALEAIILGCRMKPAIRKLIYDLNQKRSRPLRLFEVGINYENYKIDIMDYNFLKK